MKYLLLSLFILFSLSLFSQASDSLSEVSKKKSDFVSFKTKLDIANATKDGIYLNGYVVNIDYEKVKKLHGKKIKVRGRVTIIKGLQNLSKGDVVQGRDGATKHILSPKIKIIKN